MQQVAVLCLLAAAHAASFSELVQHEEWAAFKLAHKKQYGSAEDELRKQIFEESKLLVAQHNQLFQGGHSSFSLKINQFSDMLHSEYLESITEKKDIKDNRLSRQGAKLRTVWASGDLPRAPGDLPRAPGDLPRALDWRSKGAVTCVKNQGESCKASWAFSAVGALEGQYFLKTGILESLSAQNLLDCSSGYGNSGCDGGDKTDAFQYVFYNRGIDNDTTYPYQYTTGQCIYNSKDAKASCQGYVQLPEGDELELRAAVATAGPVAVSLDASPRSFRQYSRGIYYDQACTSEITNHVIDALVVGYGTDKKEGDYWLVKNSWGQSWGEEGYMRLARGRGNHCGIASDAGYPFV